MQRRRRLSNTGERCSARSAAWHAAQPELSGQIPFTPVRSTRQPLSVIKVGTTSTEQRAWLKAGEGVILEELNIKKLEILDDPTKLATATIKPNMPRLGPRLGKQVKSLATTLTTLQQIDAEKVRRLAFGESTEVDGVMLDPEDVHVEMQPFGEGELVATAGKLVVSIDTHVTEELRLEGIARDLVNRIQRDRKEIDLSVDQRIDIGASSANELTLSAISENRAFVENETLSRVTVVPSNELPDWQQALGWEPEHVFEHDIDGAPVWVALRRRAKK